LVAIRSTPFFLFSDVAILVNEGSKFKKEYPLVCLRNIERVVSPKHGHGISFRELTDSGETADTITLWTDDKKMASEWVAKILTARNKQIVLQGTGSIKKLPTFYEQDLKYRSPKPKPTLKT